MAEEGGEGGEVSAPLVFQCGKCREIVGDSFSWVCSDQTLNTVTLQGLSPKVVIEDQLETSTDQPDRGSTFCVLRCQCAAVLGRVYRTTPRSLDHLRDRLTFNIDAISSYQLGSTGLLASEDVLDLPTAASLQEEMYKVQTLILTLNERIQALEEREAAVEQGERRIAAEGGDAAHT